MEAELNVKNASIDEASFASKSIELDLGYHTTAVQPMKSVDGDAYRVAGYAVVYTDAAAKDLTREYFTKGSVKTLYDNPVILYHHGLDKDVKASPIGQVTKLVDDDIGLWAEAQLNKRNSYVKEIMKMAKNGQLGWSSGALPQSVKRGADGHLTDWNIIEISLTPTPAMPHVTAVVGKSAGHLANVDLTAQAYKAIGVSPDFLSNFLQESSSSVAKDKPEVTADVGQAKEIVEAPVATKAAPQVQTQLSQENKIMTDAPIAQAIPVPAAPVAVAPAPVAAAPVFAMTAEQLNAAIKSATDAAVAQAIQTTLANTPTKALPASEVPAVKSVSSATTYEVLGDRRFADLSSQDMSFMQDMFASYLRNPQIQNTSGYSVIKGIFDDFIHDGDKKLQRELCAKAIREVKTNRLPESIIAHLPYRNMEAIEANSYKSVAYKANELDNTAISNQGVDWVPQIWSSELWKRVRISNPVAANISVFQMAAPTVNLPIQSTDPTVYYTGEAASSTDLAFYNAQLAVTQIKTGKVAMSAKKLTARPVMSTEFTEDSIIMAIEDVREQTMRAMLNAIDNTMLNGDIVTSATTNINLIDGTPATAPNMPSYLAFDGFRKYALITNTAQSLDFAGAGPSLPQLRALQAKLAPQYAVDLPNLMLIVDFWTYQKLKGMPEFASAQNVGGPGTNILGYLPGGSSNTVAQAPYPVGIIDGYPVYVSAELGKTQATGKISGTPANNTFGNAVLYHKSRAKLGYRRTIQMDTLYTPGLSDTVQIMVSTRIAFNLFDTTSAALAYDIGV